MSKFPQKSHSLWNTRLEDPAIKWMWTTKVVRKHPGTIYIYLQSTLGVSNPNRWSEIRPPGRLFRWNQVYPHCQQKECNETVKTIFDLVLHVTETSRSKKCWPLFGPRGEIPSQVMIGDADTSDPPPTDHLSVHTCPLTSTAVIYTDVALGHQHLSWPQGTMTLTLLPSHSFLEWKGHWFWFP